MPAFRHSVKHAMVNVTEMRAMPDVSFTIAQRPYTLRCAPGQEERLEAAAADLGERVAKLSELTSGGGDRRLLVIAALELLDALRETETAETATADNTAKVEAAEAETAAAQAEAAALRAWAGSVAERIDTLTQSLDPLVPPTKDA